MRTRRWLAPVGAAGVLVIILAVVAATAVGCGDKADASDALMLGKDDNGKTFTLKAGDTVKVVLAGNPTTGYTWAAALDEASAALLRLEGEPEYVQETTDESVVGAGGTFTFTFTALKAGKATLKLIYARPWESVQPLETFEATLTVE